MLGDSNRCPPAAGEASTAFPIFKRPPVSVFPDKELWESVVSRMSRLTSE